MVDARPTPPVLRHLRLAPLLAPLHWLPATACRERRNKGKCARSSSPLRVLPWARPAQDLRIPLAAGAGGRSHLAPRLFLALDIARLLMRMRTRYTWTEGLLSCSGLWIRGAAASGQGPEVRRDGGRQALHGGRPARR